MHNAIVVASTHRKDAVLMSISFAPHARVGFISVIKIVGHNARSSVVKFRSLTEVHFEIVPYRPHTGAQSVERSCLINMNPRN